MSKFQTRAVLTLTILVTRELRLTRHLPCKAAGIPSTSRTGGADEQL
jgi:hypothetical protein